MKRYSTSIDFKFWTDRKTIKAVRAKLFLFIFLSSSLACAQGMRFSANEKIIIYSVVDQFKKECGHIAVLDESKLKEIQNFYQSRRDSMTEDLKGCYGEFLSQLVGTHNIHNQTCNDITTKKNYGKDKDLARIFVNVRKYQSGIRSYHEKLNECLVRKGGTSKDIVSYTDFEKNGRTLSRKIRETNVQMPFRENSVNYR